MLEKKPTRPVGTSNLPKINVMSPRNDQGGTVSGSGKPTTLGQRLGKAILEKAKKMQQQTTGA